MAFERAYFLGAASGDPAIAYSAREMRLPLDALAYREGVCGIYDLQVVEHAGGVNQSVDIRAGVAVIQGDVGSGAGKYVARNNAIITFTDIPALPSSGSRQHILCVQIGDKKDAGAADYDTKPILVQGPSSGALPDISALKNTLPLAIIKRTAGQAGGASVQDAHITGQRQLVGSLATAAGGFDFYGGNSQHIDRNVTTRYEPTGLLWPAYGCTVPDPTVARVINLLAGPWDLCAGAKLNGTSAGSRAAYLLISGPNGEQKRAGSIAGIGDADGTPLQVSRKFIIPGPGWSAEAFFYQNVSTFTNINDIGKGFAHFTGVHGPTVPGVAIG